ncbi:MAG: hypothetical protein H0Z28_10075 [Archaeoglobus sp.]|nr:hypothetical protein [Archaeoglobus sp.]
MTKRRSQSDHDKMVRYVVDYLKDKGFRNIKADISGFDKPNKIIWKTTGEGHIPDVTAENGSLHIFEVETEDSINDQHTEDQWELFAAYAKKYSAKFWVVVPQGSRDLAEKRLNQLGLIAKIWEVPKTIAYIEENSLKNRLRRSRESIRKGGGRRRRLRSW